MSIKPNYDERKLLKDVAGGDEYAFKIIYDLYSKKVYSFSLKILGSTILAEEVVQVTFVKIWMMEAGLNKILNLDHYLKAMSRNTCYNILRSEKIAKNFNEQFTLDWSEANNDTEESVMLNETKKILQEGIDALPQYHRQVYLLCHQQGLKYDEAAEKLSLSVFTVQTYMKLALRALRKYIKDRTELNLLLILFIFF